MGPGHGLIPWGGTATHDRTVTVSIVHVNEPNDLSRDEDATRHCAMRGLPMIRQGYMSLDLT